MISVNLTSISPVAYESVKVGDKLLLMIKVTKKNEYRDKIGSASNALLLFKGKMKVGAIPPKILLENQVLLNAKYCIVTFIDKEKNLITVNA